MIVVFLFTWQLTCCGLTFGSVVTSTNNKEFTQEAVVQMNNWVLDEKSCRWESTKETWILKHHSPGMEIVRLALHRVKAMWFTEHWTRLIAFPFPLLSWRYCSALDYTVLNTSSALIHRWRTKPQIWHPGKLQVMLMVLLHKSHLEKYCHWSAMGWQVPFAVDFHCWGVFQRADVYHSKWGIVLTGT